MKCLPTEWASKRHHIVTGIILYTSDSREPGPSDLRTCLLGNVLRHHLLSAENLIMGEKAPNLAIFVAVFANPASLEHCN
jgi:hypothetical protein